MRLSGMICAAFGFPMRGSGLLFSGLLLGAAFGAAQTDAPAAGADRASARFTVSVDEVSLTFHAADAHGLPVRDLRLEEVRVFDNGEAPRRILAFQPLHDVHIRAAILIDTSESMDQSVARDRAVAAEYAQRVFRGATDQGLIMNFGYISKIVQPWSSDARALVTGIANVTAGSANPLGGTALLDAVYRACFYEFGKASQPGNFILLFSDGEDNSSHMDLADVVNMCQRTNTAIYAFRADSQFSHSTGPRTLNQLTEQTGGRVFTPDGSAAATDAALQLIEADMRNEYWLVYRPKNLLHDGRFHSIAILGADRAENITTRSGYYAPRQ